MKIAVKAVIACLNDTFQKGWFVFERLIGRCGDYKFLEDLQCLQ